MTQDHQQFPQKPYWIWHCKFDVDNIKIMILLGVVSASDHLFRANVIVAYKLFFYSF